MRKLIITIALLIPGSVFALSCPSNGRMLDIGYTLPQVLQLCGQPTSRNDYQVTNNLSEVWTYYKTGFNNTNTRITILFNNDRVTNINVLNSSFNNSPALESNVPSSGACGQLIQAGNNTAFVRNACGIPASQNVTERTTTNMSELVYGGPGPTTLVFEDSKLVDWK